MWRYVLKRSIQTAVVLLVMSFLVYILIGLMPGDPLDMLVESGPGMTPEAMASLRAMYGLDQPLPLRYWHWLMALLQGDLGYSRTHAVPVLQVIGPALWNTCKLMVLSFLVSVALAFVLGIISALRPGGMLDGAISLFAFAGISVPVFWLALMMILVFSVKLHWLPASGTYTSGDGSIIDQARYLVMPVITLALSHVGGFTRFIRSSMIETLRMDHIRTARAKGNRERRVIFYHALRNAMIPVLTVMALSFGALFNGALLTETMFAQPGMGKMIYDSIGSNDFNLALSGLLFAAFVTLLSNLIADLAYAWLDPRISL
ncbi:ABC transporter permease [Sinorhizobium meliloti]|uniref:ABC transporter permease n=1 Tax=Rhizobium meliloti TaxID=382 RepID=UPI00129648D9|nr:ABC transporter permease [Sinorhizobium meliloti]MQU72452.1 ABC transporter permease subunit [Sinorhizobium meliloti]